VNKRVIGESVKDWWISEGLMNQWWTETGETERVGDLWIREWDWWNRDKCI